MNVLVQPARILGMGFSDGNGDRKTTPIQHFGFCRQYSIKVVAINCPDAAMKSDGLLVLIESPCRVAAEWQIIDQHIRAYVAQAFGISCRIDWIEPKQLAHTSSGKLARAKIQQAYMLHALKRLEAE